MVRSLNAAQRNVASHSSSLRSTRKAFRDMAPPGTLKRIASTDRDISPPPKRRATPSSTTNNTTAGTKPTSTTTSKAVADFFKPASQKEPEKVTFQIRHETLLVARYDYTTGSRSTAAPRQRSGGDGDGDGDVDAAARPVKIAAFDFDDTLIATTSGLKFARGEGDWRWWHPSVPGRLKRLREEKGYVVVVVSNQGGVSLKAPEGGKGGKGGRGGLGGGMKSAETFKAKVGAVLRALDVEGVSMYAATGRDGWRKPRVRMWDAVVRDYCGGGGGGGGREVDLAASFFVGDAGGRGEDKARGRMKRDHACSDRDFAENVGIAFHTPEEFFLGEEKAAFGRAFEPATYLADLNATPRATATPFARSEANVQAGKKDLILLVGSPGAGKSTYYRRHLQPLGYARVNQDTLKTRDKCLKVAAALLQEPLSSAADDEGRAGVVVDNTNADPDTRAAWVALAKRVGVKVRVVLFTAGKEVCEHNDAVRALSGSAPPLVVDDGNSSGTAGREEERVQALNNPDHRAQLPRMAFTGFAARYREPQLSEGFVDVTRVGFVFEGTEAQRRVWGRYWVS